MEILEPGPYSFLGLSDAPHSYAGFGSDFIQVNVAQTGLQFAPGTGGTGYTLLTASETVNGSLKVFTFAAATSQPTFVVADNVLLRPTTNAGDVNWTWNNGTKQASLTTPPQSEVFALQ